MEIIQKVVVYRKLALALLCMLVIFSQASRADFSASVDRTTLGLNDTLELQLRSDNDNTDNPRLEALERDFAILSTRQSRQVRIINGRSEAWQDWVITLAPKKKGVLTIPSLTLAGEHTAPLTVVVQDNPRPATGNRISPVFMRAELDSEQVYIQQEVILTLKIFHRVNLYDDSRLSPLEIADAIVQQLGDTQKYDVVLEGTRYGVFELKFAIYPQKTGLLNIPSMTFTGTMADNSSPFGGMFSMGGKPVVARSADIQLNVQEQPADYPGHDWLPAKKLTLEESWSQGSQAIRVGDAVTRTITMQAKGLNAAQLPPLSLPALSGANSYPDQSSTEDIPSTNGITGKRVSAMAIVPTQAGTLVVPPVKIPWFDTQTQQIKFAEIPGKTLQVLPAENPEPVAPVKATAPTATAEKPADTGAGQPEVHSATPVSRFWQWLVALLVLLWLLTVGLFWRFWKKSATNGSSHPSSPAQPSATRRPKAWDERSLFVHFEKVCRAQEKPVMILESFKQWSRVFLQAPGLTSVQQCARRFGSEPLEQLCQQIDAAIYCGKPAQAETEALLELCRKIRKQQPQQRTAMEDSLELYPSS